MNLALDGKIYSIHGLGSDLRTADDALDMRSVSKSVSGDEAHERQAVGTSRTPARTPAAMARGDDAHRMRFVICSICRFAEPSTLQSW